MKTSRFAAVAALVAVVTSLACLWPPSAARAQDGATATTPTPATDPTAGIPPTPAFQNPGFVIASGGLYVAKGRVMHSDGSSALLAASYRFATPATGWDVITTSWYITQPNSTTSDSFAQTTEVRRSFGSGGSSYVALGFGTSTTTLLGTAVATFGVGTNVSFLRLEARGLTNLHNGNTGIGFSIGIKP